MAIAFSLCYGELIIYNMTPDKLKNNKYALKALSIAFFGMIIFPVLLILILEHLGWMF